MKNQFLMCDNTDQPLPDGIAEGNPKVGRFEKDASRPGSENSQIDVPDSIPPGTLCDREFFSPAKMKSILTEVAKCEKDPFKLVARKLAEAAFLRPESTD